jgi:hypothetical protein
MLNLALNGVLFLFEWGLSSNPSSNNLYSVVIVLYSILR